MDRQTFSFSDACVIASLFSEPSELRELIITADVLNHAILQRDEIVQGLIKAQRCGLATVSDNKFSLTPLGESIKSKASTRGGLFSLVENLRKKLNSNRTELGWVPEVNDCSFISKGAIEAAHETYRASLENNDGGA